MEKFDSTKHADYAKNLPFSYFSSMASLDLTGYTFLRNNEHVIVWQDLLFPHDFPSIFVPQNKLNWERASIAFVTPEEVGQIKKEGIEIMLDKFIENEYFYKTEALITPHSDIKRRISQFQNSYEFEIFNSYPKEKIKEFYQFWKGQKSRDSLTFSEADEEFSKLLNILEKYDIKQVYVTVKNKLIGFTWGVAHQSGNWVGLQLKVNYEYKGLSRFLHHERAKLFSDREFFTIGTGAREVGIAQFKEELGPAYKKEYHYVLTGDKMLKK